MAPKSPHNIPNGRSHGVMVSTLDSESSDPSSNFGGTLQWCAKQPFFLLQFFYSINYAAYIKQLDSYLAA